MVVAVTVLGSEVMWVVVLVSRELVWVVVSGGEARARVGGGWSTGRAGQIVLEMAARSMRMVEGGLMGRKEGKG